MLYGQKTKNIVTFIIFLSFNLLFSTNGLNMIGYGPRSSSLGGVSLALSNNIFGLNTNPASISFVSDEQIGVSLGVLNSHARYIDNTNYIMSDKDLFLTPAISYINGSQIESYSNKFRWGVGFFSKNMGVNYENVNFDVYRQYDYNTETNDDLLPQRVSSNISSFKLLPTLSILVDRNLSIGFAPILNYTMFKMETPISYGLENLNGQTNERINFGQFMRNLSYDELTASIVLNADGYGAGFQLGAFYKFNRKLVFGLSYRQEPLITLKSTASVNVNSQVNSILNQLIEQDPEITNYQEAVTKFESLSTFDLTAGYQSNYSAEIQMSEPIEIGAGFKYNIKDNWMIGADIKFINWGTVMKELNIKMYSPTNNNLKVLTGRNNIDFNIPLYWSDQITFSLGSEYIYKNQYALRIGYNYSSNPIPNNTAFLIFPSIIEHHLTTGIGYGINNLQFDFAYELNLENTVETNESIISTEYSNSTNRLFEQIAHISMIYKL